MVRKKNVKTATTKLKDLELGTKFKLACSDTTGILIEKSIGAATVIVIDVPKTPSFINKDGSIDIMANNYIVNIPYINMANILSDKTINHIFIDNKYFNDVL